MAVRTYRIVVAVEDTSSHELTVHLATRTNERYTVDTGHHRSLDHLLMRKYEQRLAASIWSQLREWRSTVTTEKISYGWENTTLSTTKNVALPVVCLVVIDTINSLNTSTSDQRQFATSEWIVYGENEHLRSPISSCGLSRHLWMAMSCDPHFWKGMMHRTFGKHSQGIRYKRNSQRTAGLRTCIGTARNVSLEDQDLLSIFHFNTVRHGTFWVYCI